MMLGWNGIEGGIDTFPFHLARELGMSLDQVRQMPYPDIVAWKAFYKVETTMAKQK